jgi:hypothetical protein
MCERVRERKEEGMYEEDCVRGKGKEILEKGCEKERSERKSRGRDEKETYEKDY